MIDDMVSGYVELEPGKMPKQECIDKVCPTMYDSRYKGKFNFIFLNMNSNCGECQKYLKTDNKFEICTDDDLIKYIRAKD